MASPQPDQFTRIANEILEVLAKTKLNGTQRRILDVVFRYTYGFQRKQHELSLTFLTDALGMKRTQIKQVKRELDSLIESKILIEVNKPDKNKTRTIEFNKDYDQWTVVEKDQSSKKTSGLIRPVTGIELVQSSGIELDHQERKKENLKKIYSPDSIEMELTMYLFNLMRENNPSVKSPDFQKWADTMEKLIRIDKKTAEDIKAVINWCQQDSFWKSNILSVDKLRKQYDQLYIKSGLAKKKQDTVSPNKEYLKIRQQIDGDLDATS